MKSSNLLCAVAVFLFASFAALAQQSSRSPSAMSASFCIIKMFGTNNCTARCDVRILNDSFKESSTEGFALLDGKMRQEMDVSQFKAQMFPPAAVRQMGIDLQVVVLRPDLKLAYNIYPRLKSYVIRPLPKGDAAAQGKEPTMEVTELGKEDVDGHPCVKKFFVVTTGDGEKHEIFAWLASDLKDFPVKTQVRDEANIEVTTYKQIQFFPPDAKLFEPPAEFTKYSDFKEMMDATQTNRVAGFDTNAASTDSERIVSIIDFTLQKGINKPISNTTAKALGLGDDKIPATQIVVGNKDEPLVCCFGVSARNTNDLFVASIDQHTRAGTVWLTSRAGKIRATVLISTNVPPVEVSNDGYASEFEKQIEMLLEFIAPAPWEDAPHPLNVAAKYGGVADVEKILKADEKAINAPDDEGMTPLACAVVQQQVDVVQFLLDKGADPNIPNKNGLTPLEHACGRDKTVGTTLAKLLVAKGAEVNPTNKTDWKIPPLSWAVSSDNTELVEFLLAHGADPKARDGNILRSAAGRGDTEIVALLIEHGADPKAMSDGTTPLIDAAWDGRDAVIKLLLSKGAEVQASRSDGVNALISAADREHNSTVKILLASGADINAADKKGNTPLHSAVARGNKEVVETLLAHGAKIDLKNKHGETLLQFAAKCRQPAMVEFLRQHGAKE